LGQEIFWGGATAFGEVDKEFLIHNEFRYRNNVTDSYPILKEYYLRLKNLKIDSKALALKNLIEEILEKEPKTKIIIFTQFIRTLYYLIKFLEYCLPVAKELVVLVRDGDRTVLRANTTACTFLKVDEMRLYRDFRMKITRLSRQLRHFGVGDYLYIPVCPGGNQPW